MLTIIKNLFATIVILVFLSIAIAVVFAAATIGINGGKHVSEYLFNRETTVQSLWNAHDQAEAGRISNDWK